MSNVIRETLEKNIEALPIIIHDYVEYGKLPPLDIYTFIVNNPIKIYELSDKRGLTWMRDIMGYCCEHVPAIARGSNERVIKWIMKRAINRAA